VHYSAGFGGLAALGGAGLTAERLGVTPLARVLLEGSGAIFGLYLLVMIALSVMGAWMRRRDAGDAALEPAAPHWRRLPASRHAR
jgi:hypothetical protein